MITENGNSAELFGGDATGLRQGSLADRIKESRRLLRIAVTKTFADRIALVTSFGAESAVLLHLVAETDPTTPVVFINTGKLFGETLSHRNQLLKRLGLVNLREVKPDPIAITEKDPDGSLWLQDNAACCYIRKVKPFEDATKNFDALITGRKASHGGARAGLETFDLTDNGKIRLNPLVHWSSKDIADYIAEQNLPTHPLVADGYLSIGCMPCTDRVVVGEDPRAGRWRGSDKSECGIHLEIPLKKPA